MTVCRLYVFVNVEGSYLHPRGKLLTSEREVTYIREGSYLHPRGKLLTSLRKVGFFLCISKLNRTSDFV